MNKVNIKSATYTILVSLAFLFHVFNKIQINESIKLFHVFCGCAICAGLLLNRFRDKVSNAFLQLVLWTAISSVLSVSDSSLDVLLKFSIVSFSVFFIPYVPIKRLVSYVNCLIPIALIRLLLHYLQSDAGSFYRFQGFYEDPNYLCTTLLVMYFYIQLLWNLLANKWIKIGLIIEILLIFLLVSASISRTGIVCFLLMTVVFWWDVIKKNIKTSVIFIPVFGIVIFVCFHEYIQNALEGYSMRETHRNDSISSASDLRWQISLNGIRFLFSHPSYFFQGIGIGTYSTATNCIPGWQTSMSTRWFIDHNTITGWFSEQGMVGLVLLVRFLYLICKRIVSNMNFKIMHLNTYFVSVFGIFLLFSISINQTNYLPWWFLIFTLISLSKQSLN